MKIEKNVINTLSFLLNERNRINKISGFKPNFDDLNEYIHIITFPNNNDIGKGVDNKNKHLFYFKTYEDLSLFYKLYKEELMQVSKELF